jgi:hypothetical protein
MKLTTGIQATIKTAGETDPTEIEARALVFAAFPPLMGQLGVEIEPLDGDDWLVTFPTEAWEAIQETGYFNCTVRLSDGGWAKLAVDVA